MTGQADAYLGPGAAAAVLGVSGKALRGYEARGLLTPVRSAAGWRAYGPAQMQRAREIVGLTRLGLSLRQVGRMLEGDAAGLDGILAAQQKRLEREAKVAASRIEKVAALRAQLARGEVPEISALLALGDAAEVPSGVAVTLPWPWGGDVLQLPLLGPLTYLVGSLGSGKTRLAMALAAAVPGARFVGLARDGAEMAAEPVVEQALAALSADGAQRSAQLEALVGALLAPAGALIVDLVEEGLDAATQEAVGAWLRQLATAERPLVVMTRSTAILDLDCVGPDAALLYCPANHDAPFLVPPVAGARGYEALVGCLATPEVRARVAGVRATRVAV